MKKYIPEAIQAWNRLLLMKCDWKSVILVRLHRSDAASAAKRANVSVICEIKELLTAPPKFCYK